MPISVHGTTDITAVSLGLAKNGKSVCIIGTGTKDVKTKENELLTIFSIADGEAKFGANSDTAKMIEVLFKNGVKSVFAIMADKLSDLGKGSDEAENKYGKAFDELLKYNHIKILLVDKTDPKIIAKLKDHLDLAESQDILRYAVVGTDSDTNEKLTEFAGTLNSKRMFVPGPQVLGSGGKAVSPLMSCAGLASLISTETNDPALPMNGVMMNGFYGVSRVLLKTECDALANGGVTPLCGDNGKPTIYKLMTTYTKDNNKQTDHTWSDGTTILIADKVLDDCRNRIKSKYKRTKNVARILDAMRTDIIDVLQTNEGLEIIQNVDTNTISVIKDPNDVFGALIDYEFDVVTPLYTVTIRQHVKL